MAVSSSYEMLKALAKAPSASGLHIRILTQFEKEWVMSEIRKQDFDVERPWFGLFISVKAPQLPIFVSNDLHTFEAGLQADGFNIHRTG